MRVYLASLLVLTALSGCRGTTIEALVQESYPPHGERVCIITGALPASVPHVAVANVEVKPRGYGGDRKAKAALGEAARRIGAHVVQQVSFGNMMGAAEGTGVAVVLTATPRLFPPECEWY